MEKRLFIVDDHTMIRNGITGWFNSNSDWECTSGAGSKDDALVALEKLSAQNNLPNVVISDINMQGTPQGIELISEISEKFPQIKIVAYSMYTSPGMIQKAMKAGAQGYVSKTNDEKNLLECIEAVYAGEQYIGQELMLSLCSYNNVISALTKREMQVFELILQRKTNPEIAEALDLKRHAVENYISFIYEKTGCTDRSELMRKYGEKS
ncbi:MAG: response regulator transcription factor [Treponema sp.]|nr:response regulator transcription factor [Candidatus Treponema equifaecale]